MAGVKFVDKDTVVENVLSNTTGFLPMWQDNGALKVPVSMLRMQAVASCTSAASTVAKSATISNMPDFELRNGLIITVAFTNGNSASSPTLNINEKGAWPLRCEGQASSVTIGDGCWSAGALITVQYVEVDSSHKYFLMLGHNVASVNSTTGITTRADGTQVCSTTALNSALSNFATKLKYTSQSESLIVNDFFNKGYFVYGTPKVINNVIGVCNNTCFAQMDYNGYGIINLKNNGSNVVQLNRNNSTQYNMTVLIF